MQHLVLVLAHGREKGSCPAGDALVEFPLRVQIGLEEGMVRGQGFQTHLRLRDDFLEGLEEWFHETLHEGDLG